MAIDRLSSTSALIATLRAGVARTTGQGAQVEATGGPPARANAAKSRPDVGVLRRQLVEMVRGETIEDPAVVKRLRPRLVRAILLWEFGASLREHPEWQPMLEDIVSTLESNPAQVEHFSALLADLKRAAG